MKRFEALRKEFYEKPEGTFAPEYFRSLGYKAYMAEPITIFRARGIEALFTKSRPHIFMNDLIVGNTHSLYCQLDDLTLEDARKINRIIGGRSFHTNADHYAPEYIHILQVGIVGMLEEISASKELHAKEPEKLENLEAMAITLRAFREMIANYKKAAEALLLKKHVSYDKKRLQFIIENCEALIEGAPKTFAQALQLIWFCHTAFLMEGRGAMALGRMDQYLYPFYQADMDAGCLTQENAIELLENVFTKIDTSDVVNICIGGSSQDGTCQVNDLSYAILAAVKNCNAPGPNLSLRYTLDTPDDFMIECLKSIGTGLGYPAIMNDAVNIAALRKYGYEEADIYNYSMVGCIENFMTGMQPPWSDARFDTPRFFDYVFNHGKSDFNKSLGLDLGSVEEITSMQEFMKRFEAELSFGVAQYCRYFEADNDRINQAYYAEPFLSCFCYDCIGRGLDINSGGSKYPSVHGAALMGIATTVDSLAAIEQIVFVDKAATLEEIGEALRHNFEGYEDLREKVLAAPKYGNNDDFVDKYAIWYTDFFAKEFGKYRTRDGGGMYIAMAANVQNVSAGAIINATPDGRKVGEPLSDAASPTYGRDTKGATVTLNSLSKLDYTKVACGTVINQKFSPSMFEGEKIYKLLALIKTYMKKGGQEVQINATSREILLDAMEHPELYQNLVVRVSGFSDYYVRLSKEVQLDILNRTQQE